MSKKRMGRPPRGPKSRLVAEISDDRLKKFREFAGKKQWSIRVALESILDYFFANGGDKK